MKVLKIGDKLCKGCAIMRPIWKEIEEEFPLLETEYYEFKDNKELAEQYNVEVIPTFIFLEDNKEVARLVGEVDKDAIIEIIW